MQGRGGVLESGSEPDRRGLIKLVLLWLAAILVFLFFYSRALFVLLMAQYDFFSYDLFQFGGWGMSLFYVTAELMVVMSGLGFFGVLLPLAERRFGKPPYSSSLLFFGSINLGFWLLLAVLVIGSEDWDWRLHVPKLAVALIVAAHLAVTLYAPRVTKLRWGLSVVLILCGLTAILQQPMVSLLSHGLKTYGVGGELPVALEYPDGSTDHGRLVLLSPENVYFIPENNGNGRLTIVKRTALKRIVVFRAE